MLQHRLLHAAKSAASLLNPVKIGETLRQDRITGTRSITALAKIRQGERFRRKSRTSHHHPVRKDLDHDFAATVFIESVRHGVYKRLAQGFDAGIPPVLLD